MGQIWDIVTGNTRPYGYELKFVALVKVSDTEKLTMRELLTTMCAADMSSFVTNYLPASPMSTLSDQMTVTYGDLLD